MLLHLLNKPDGLCHLFLVECVDKNATEVSMNMWQFPCILASALFLGGSCHSWAMDAHLSSPHRSVSPGGKAQAEMETFCILLQAQLCWSPGAASATLDVVSAGGSCWLRMCLLTASL